MIENIEVTNGKAEAAGISPKEYVDQISGEVKRIWDMVNSSYDNFVRTTDEDHEKCVKKIFKKLYDQGDIYAGLLLYIISSICLAWLFTQLMKKIPNPKQDRLSVNH